MDTRRSTIDNKQMPLISIIIPSYNNGRYIPQAIRSVLAQEYQPLEIIVIDDGSTDDTMVQLEPFQNNIYYNYQQNAGSGAARNNGLRRAGGKYVLFLDADDWLLPGKLHKQVQILESNATLGAVHSGWRVVNEKGEKFKDVEPWQQAPHLNLDSWLQWKPVRLGAMMITQAWLSRVGFFDPELKQSQDLDLMLRLAVAGCPMVWLREVTMCYRLHQDSTIRAGAANHPQFALRVLDKFFADANLPQRIRDKERITRYYLTMWESWHLFRSGIPAAAVPYLQQTLPHSPYNLYFTVQDWLRNYSTWSAKNGLSPLDIRQMWPHFQAAAGLDEAAWTPIQQRMDWWLHVWWPYLQGDYLHAATALKDYAHLQPHKLIRMVQFFAIFSPLPITPELIARFERDAQAAGLLVPKDKTLATTLYLMVCAQAILEKKPPKIIAALGGALRHGWRPHVWPVWRRFLRTGRVVLAGQNQHAIRILLQLAD